MVALKKESLAEHFMKAVLVKGTQQYHRFVPVEPFGTLQVFKVSTEQMGRSVSCLKSDDKLEDDFVVEEGELVGAYVGCVYEKQLWFAMIEELSDEFGDLLVSFLGPQGFLDPMLFHQKWTDCGCLGSGVKDFNFLPIWQVAVSQHAKKFEKSHGINGQLDKLEDELNKQSQFYNVLLNKLRGMQQQQQQQNVGDEAVLQACQTYK
ncbi:hypothetical protein GWK47_007060 [Chionoecetes opilio]|uniref:Uncharacterized protein n=1 Tax=Chionoecetes opilio TaxID=41210 RepID=A0A8J4Y2H5_CHIOP|nr:hypothetical protein GWK47_007060 [Chionoecetes opilio]